MSAKVAYSAVTPEALNIFNPLTYWTSSSGQYGLVNIRYGASSDPQVERAIIENVAGYGQQLGKLLDAVEEIANYLGKTDRGVKEIDAIKQLHELALAIAATKETAAATESMPLPEFIDGLKRLKKNNREAFERVKEKLEAVPK